jgi:hypothetical protein
MHSQKKDLDIENKWLVEGDLENKGLTEFDLVNKELMGQNFAAHAKTGSEQAPSARLLSSQKNNFEGKGLMRLIS